MKYIFDNWNQVLALPEGQDKQQQLRIIGHLTKGNLQWFVRKLIGFEEDITHFPNEVLPKSDFLRRMDK